MSDKLYHKDEIQSLAKNFFQKFLKTMIISPISHNAKTSFKSKHINNFESNSNSVTGYLNHTSHFFRYEGNFDDIGPDEAMLKYFKKTHKAPIKIVSAGSSWGEEAYSLAMGIKALKMQGEVTGFDTSKTVVQRAKNATYTLDMLDYRTLLTEPEGNTTPFKKEIQNVFKENFQRLDIPPEDSFIYSKKKDSDLNCKFFRGEIRYIDSYFEKNSLDMVTCRNVLYHLDDEDCEKTLKAIKTVLKPNGFLSVAPSETESYTKFLKSIGFSQPFKDNACVYKKQGRLKEFLSKFKPC